MRKKLHRILVTGGAGFIGSEFVRQAVARGYQVCVVDKLTYAGDRDRLTAVASKIRFIQSDIAHRKSLERAIKSIRPWSIVHFAAESHVDRSIVDASPFIETNVRGTQVLLDLARDFEVKKFVHLSTDEVYGEIEDGLFSEESPFSPNSPYSASKAAADHLVCAYVRTYKLPAVIARPCNNFGLWQFPEKLIPVVILNALKRRRVPVYAKGENVREWLHVSDCARALFCLLEKGDVGEVYNIGSGQRRRNIDTVKTILSLLGKSQKLISFVKDRAGHDLRYALDSSKLRRKLGWSPEVHFEDGLRQTVNWYKSSKYCDV